MVYATVTKNKMDRDVLKCKGKYIKQSGKHKTIPIICFYLGKFWKDTQEVSEDASFGDCD